MRDAVALRGHQCQRGRDQPRHQPAGRAPGPRPGARHARVALAGGTGNGLANALSAVACSAVDAGNACIQASMNGYSSGAEGTRILRVLSARHPQFPASRALLYTSPFGVAPFEALTT